MSLKHFLAIALLSFSAIAHLQARLDMDKLDRFLSKKNEIEGFQGSVLIAKNDLVLFQKSYGYANITSGQPNKNHTAHNLASVGKLFTAVAVLKLVQEGCLLLDAPLYKYLSGFSDPKAKNVTVRDLLSHRSGWGSYWNSSYYIENKAKLISVDDYFTFLKDVRLLTNPGSREIYSNTGYILLGKLIEVVSGQNYYQYINSNILAPLHMNDTGFYTSSEAEQHKSLGYTKYSRIRHRSEEALPKPNSAFLPFKGTPAGGGYATTEDLFRFAVGLVSSKILDSKHLKLLITKYGYDKLGHHIIHLGGFPGIATHFEHDLRSGYTFVLLANSDPETVLSIPKFLVENMEIPLSRIY